VFQADNVKAALFCINRVDDFKVLLAVQACLPKPIIYYDVRRAITENLTKVR
jgi:hypothetical protein